MAERSALFLIGGVLSSDLYPKTDQTLRLLVFFSLCRQVPGQYLKLGYYS
jgi:hypothetical protein